LREYLFHLDGFDRWRDVAEWGWLGKATGEAEKALTKGEAKSIRSLEKRVAEHQQKIAEFKQNPTVKPGMEGLSKEKNRGSAGSKSRAS
jgi:hypothetical protein